MSFFSKVIMKGAGEVVTLQTAKSQLNIVTSDDDEHIQLLINVATDLAETYTNRLFTVSQVELVSRGQDSFFLPYGEVENVTACKLDLDDTDIDYDFSVIDQKIYLDLSQELLSEPVRVEFEAGYSSVPFIAQMGVLMLLSTLYENREDIVLGMQVQDIPISSTAILDGIKLDYAQ